MVLIAAPAPLIAPQTASATSTAHIPTADAVNDVPRDEGGEDVPELQQAAREKGHLCTTKCFQIGGSF